MIPLDHRQRLVRDIDQAHREGARLRPACLVAGIDVRTLQRWCSTGLALQEDQRKHCHRATPAHALTHEERQEILRVANEPRFADMPPSRIVPMLADEGRYIASESSFARVLRAHGQNQRRGRAQLPQTRKPPSTHIATAPKQVWCWDMTYLRSHVTGQWFYLFVIMDLYSRKIVGWEVHASDGADHAVRLVQRTALAEGIAHLPAHRRPVLHGDNGSAFKATTVLAMLHWLGIKPSYSRPRVSDDNAFVESLFRTAKYRPEYPAHGFCDLASARQWAAEFVHWYNHEHRHSGIQFVTPHQRHTGKDKAILAHRHQVYGQAKQNRPARWSRHTRNWQPIEAVALNPERAESITQKIRLAA